MSQTCFHASIEGAQHGGKSLTEFLDFAKTSGASGVQPSNFLLENGSVFHSAATIRSLLAERNLRLDGISAHCPFWVHTTAWTSSPTIRPFLPESLHHAAPQEIESWSEDYLIRLMHLASELDIRIIPMFWGTVYGWEVAGGYPWGFWSGSNYDLIKEGDERFVSRTARLRETANQLGIRIAHEIHPGTAAMTAQDFLHLVEICDGDPCLTVNADPSHCWEGESWEQRFLAVGKRVVAAHVKNFTVRSGFPLRCMTGDWTGRAMQFTDLSSGDLNLRRYVELLIHIGYPQRYRDIMKTPTAPLVVEAESAYRDLNACSADGIAFTRDQLCFPVATGSFEDGMGA
ncbi:MAG: sugar phosphate isomerase/epimerase family protein [Candidatus Methylacidiphilales bacterium]